MSNYRPLVLTTAVIGAKNDFTNGYLGCLRSLWLNGFKITMESMKNQLKGSFILHVCRLLHNFKKICPNGHLKFGDVFSHIIIITKNTAD